MIKATHTTPVKGYIVDLEFTFADAADGSCSMQVSREKRERTLKQEYARRLFVLYR